MKRLLASLMGVLCLLTGAWLWPQERPRAEPAPETFEQWAALQDTKSTGPPRLLTGKERLQIIALLEDTRRPSMYTGAHSGTQNQRKNQTANYIVTGAGLSEWNGTYVDNGTYAGHRAYIKDETHLLRWFNSSGCYVLETGNAAYYFGPETGAIEGRWRELPTHDFAYPSPTIRLAAVDSTRPRMP